MTRTQRPAMVTIPITFGLFFGGGIGGVGLATWLAPDSILAHFVGLLALPIAFITGMQLWLGFALISALAYGVRRLLGRVDKAPSSMAGDRGVPPGSYSFLLTSVAVSVAAGVVMAIVATRIGFFATLLTYVLLGLVYGLTCWLLARAGFLPFAEG